MNTADSQSGSLSVLFAAGSVLLFWGGSGLILLLVRGTGMPAWAEGILLLTCVGYVAGIAGLVIGVIESSRTGKHGFATIGVLLNLVNTIASSVMGLVFTLPLMLGFFERITHV